MNKAAPSFGRIAAMVVFALSCFGLLLFLWLAFGGAVPLKPKGYRFNASFAEATQLATEADVRISGVPVGKVKTIEPDKTTGRSIVVIELESRYAPLPSDARAILRQKTLLGETYVELTPGSRDAPNRCPRAARWPSRRSPTPSSSTRSSARSTPTRARRSRPGCRSRRRGSAATGATSTTRSATSARSPRTPRGWSTSSTARRARSRSLVSNTGVVFDALSERDGQLRSLIENSNRVFQATASRDEELKQTFIALPTFERESTLTLDRLAEFAADTEPAGHPAAAGGARAEPDAAGPRRAVARPGGAVPRARTR